MPPNPTVDSPAPEPEAIPSEQPLTVALSQRTLLVMLVFCASSLLLAGWLWFKLSDIQTSLARQSGDNAAVAVDARVAAKQAQELSRETAARLALTETRLSEVSLQRSQLEELMQSLSRSRDENLVVDIDSALRLALQQSQLTGSLQPVLAALKSAQQRLARVGQPRLAPLQAAIVRELDRVQALKVADSLSLLNKLDELVRLVDEWPLSNAVDVPAEPLPTGVGPVGWSRAISVSWWEQWLREVLTQTADLLRISRIDQPDASLLTPSHSFFVRENIKLRLLNARLGLMARQYSSVQSDLVWVQRDMERYFRPQVRHALAAKLLLTELNAQLKQVDIPGLEDVLAALAAASAGR